MKIETIKIENITGNGLKGDCADNRHIKTLPCLSVVQSVHGRYVIALGDGTPSITDEGGAFVAPAGVRQNILHCNGAGNYMEAQWVFMDIIINDIFAFEDVFDMPLCISSHYQQPLFDLISVIRNGSSICQTYVAAYQLTDILLSLSTAKVPAFNDSVALLKRYIDKHYREPITKETLSQIVHCSVPNLYRIFQNHFHLSPCNYINKVRLEKASVLLENTDASIAAIAEQVGFDDPAYFSKLFKEHFLISPKKYRESLPSSTGNTTNG